MKYFVFDLGGVLSVPMMTKKLYDEIKWNIPFEKFQEIFNESEESLKAHKGEITTAEFLNYLSNYIDENITLEKFEEIYINNNEFYQDTIDTINYLKTLGYKVCLLSNLKEIDYEKLKQNFDTSIFDKMFLSFELDMLKPYDDIYQYVISILDTKPQNIYFFDDNRENVEAAIRNGINAFQSTGLNIKEKVLKILNKSN